MASKQRLRTLIEELSRDSVVALVRCEAGRPYGGLSQEEAQVAVGRLRELELVELRSWSCTKLGLEVVQELVGVRVGGVSTQLRMPRTVEGIPTQLRAPRPYQPPQPEEKFQPKPGAHIAKCLTNLKIACALCKKDIPAKEKAVWISEVGVFHPDCVEFSEDDLAS